MVWRNLLPGAAVKVILVIHSLAGGGAERVMSLLANGWARLGIDVSILTIGPAAGDAYALDHRVKRVGLDLLGASDGAVAAIYNNLRRILRLRAAIRALEPEALVSFLASTNALSVLAAKPLKLPVIVSERVWPEADRLGRAWWWLRKHAYRRAAAVVAQNHRVAQWLQREIPGANVEVIGNPVDIQCAEQPDVVMNTALTCCNGHNLILAAGRLSEQKGFDLLIRAFAPIARRRPNWVLAIMGEGQERSALDALSRELEIADRVLLPGFSRSIHLMMQRSQLFVLPSRYEGMPNVLAEAMACGVPCISFDCPTGPAELISHEDNGVLVPAEDVGALTSALDRLMEDESLRLRLGRAAQKSMEAFSVDNVLVSWNDLLARTVRLKRLGGRER